MSAEVEESEDEDAVVYLINKEPVWLNVTFVAVGVVASELVIVVFCGKSVAGGENLDGEI